MILKPEDIDPNLILMGDEEDDYSMSVEEFRCYAEQIQAEGGRLVSVYDAEGDRVCIAPAKIAERIKEALNLVADIEELVEQNPDVFIDTPAGDSIVGGERWPPRGNAMRTSALERALAALQKLI